MSKMCWHCSGCYHPVPPSFPFIFLPQFLLPWFFFFLCPPAHSPAIHLFFHFICCPDLLIEVRRPEIMAVKLSLFGLFGAVSGPTNTFDDLIQYLQTVYPRSPGSLLVSTLASIREVPILSFYLTFRVKFRFFFFFFFFFGFWWSHSFGCYVTLALSDCPHGIQAQSLP